MILNNVELKWARFVPDYPDQGFDKVTPQWNCQVITRDKAQAESWKAAGLSPKADSDDVGVIYRMNVKKLATNKDGSAARPVPVVGGDMLPLDAEDIECIGNGSIANVKVRTFEYNFQGREGVGVRLEAVQITRLIRYENASVSALSGFEAIDADDESFDDVDAYA